MRKLLYTLLAVSIIFSACKKEEDLVIELTSELEGILDKKWEGNVEDFGNIIFELDADGSLNLYNVNICGDYLPPQYIGSWSFKGDTILYNYISNNFEYNKIFGIVTEFNSNKIKFFVDQFTQSTCSIHYLNSINNCTYVPDDNFEDYLENRGIGNGIANDNAVITSSIDTLIYLILGNKNITELTGIEDFTSLEILFCSKNQLTNLDVSENTALTWLNCGDNQLTSLDLGDNLLLEKLECDENQLTSLDVGQNTLLTSLGCWTNQLTSLDVSNNTYLTSLNCGVNQLTSLDLRNGNNVNFTYFYSQENPSLNCINVDDAIWSTVNWTVANELIDAQHYFSNNCPN